VNSIDNGGDPHEESADERTLRCLLDQGSPRLAAPPDLVRQVHRRIARRTRRRTAVLSVMAGVVAAGGVAGGLWARTLPPPGGAPAAVGALPSATPASAPDTLGLVFRPVGPWQTLDTWDSRSYATVFLTNRSLDDDRARGCAEPTIGGFTCAPVHHLVDGEVLIALRQEDDTLVAHGEGEAPFTVKPLAVPDHQCRDLGGTREWMGWGNRPADPLEHPAVKAYVCFRNPSDALAGEVDTMLRSARFATTPTAYVTAPGAPKAPSGGPTAMP
jgi:hypothetical protein